MTMTDARNRFRPATAAERELLAECVTIAAGPDGCGDVAAVLSDAVRFWMTSGRAIQPRAWRSRVAAAERLLARAANQ